MEKLINPIVVVAMKTGRIVDQVVELEDEIILYDIEKESFLRLDRANLSVRDLYADNGL